MTKMNSYPHRRLNPLTGEFVLVSPHRAQRPWQGQQDAIVEEVRKVYEPTCYLCPGNERVGGQVNPHYHETYVFVNDHPAVLPDSPVPSEGHSPLFQAEGVQGTARVICFSPRHDLTLAECSTGEIERVIATWQDQFAQLSQTYPWVQVFENKGAMMGCSSPHPHGQIWAVNYLPNEALKEDRAQKDYWNEHKRALLLDYVEQEIKQAERVVVSNDDWAVVVPYWAVWPFETLLLPRFAVKRIDQLSAQQRASLAAILKQHLQGYDRLFNVSMPYSMGWHNAPANGEENHHWQLHAHFYPPLLRSASVKKFMVGFELLAEAQRDLTPEQAAQRLRDCQKGLT